MSEPAARGAQLAGGDLGGDARDHRLGGADRGFGLLHLRFGGAHAGAGGGDLGLGDADVGLGAARAGGIVLDLLRGRGAVGEQGARTGCGTARDVEVGAALHQHRLGHRHVGVALGHQRARRLARADRVGHLGARLGKLRLQRLDVHARDHAVLGDEVAFVHQDLVHPTGRLGGDVDLGGLDAAVAAHEAAVVRGRAEELPRARRRNDHHADPDPGEPAALCCVHGNHLGIMPPVLPRVHLGAASSGAVKRLATGAQNAALDAGWGNYAPVCGVAPSRRAGCDCFVRRLPRPAGLRTAAVVSSPPCQPRPL